MASTSKTSSNMNMVVAVDVVDDLDVEAAQSAEILKRELVSRGAKLQPSAGAEPPAVRIVVDGHFLCDGRVEIECSGQKSLVALEDVVEIAMEKIRAK
jgi:hypothetical protein